MAALEIVVAANRDAYTRVSADAAHSAAAGTAATAATPPQELLAQELAAVKRCILDVDGDIARAEKQLAAAIEKRDRFEGDEKKWERYDGDVQRLAKEKVQLRDEKALLLKKEEQLRDELKRKELVLERIGESHAQV